MTTKLKTLLGLGLCLASINARAYVVLQDTFNYATTGGGALDTNSGFIWGPGQGNAPLKNEWTIKTTGFVTSQGTSSTADQPWRFFTNGDFLTVDRNSYPINYTAAGNTYFPSADFPLMSGGSPAFGYFPANSTSTALYYSFTMNLAAAAPGIVGDTAAYFCYLSDTNFVYRCAIWTATNGATAPTTHYRLAISGTTAYHTNTVQQDLTYGTTYQVVARYVLTNGACSLWVQPLGSTFSENLNASTIFATNTVTNYVATNGNPIAGANLSATCMFGLRNYFTGSVTMGNLIVGTQFADVIPGSVNPPSYVIQPLDDTAAFAGGSATFTALATGDPTITYQWYSLIGAVTTPLTTGPTLTLSGLTTGQSGSYYVVASNGENPNAQSRMAVLTVYSSPVDPTISLQPSPATVNDGDTATFSVTASGVPPPTYQWYWVTNSISGLKTNTLAGQTTSALSISPATPTNSGSYFVLVTNYFNGTMFNGAPGGSITSSVVSLTVNPAISTSIYALRQLTTVQNGGTYNYYGPTNTTALYTVTGIVTTWTNTTTTANTEFYLQDNTAGICVFWSGAAPSNHLPAAGDSMTVTAPLANFDGLLELEPVVANTLTSVVTNSIGNPLPKPMPLPFDPSLTGNAAEMNNLGSSYFVASNVFLQATPPTYVSGSTEDITNILTENSLTDEDQSATFDYTFNNAAGSGFEIYWNAYTGIPGNTKPNGPVTIYGILGYFEGAYQFTPTRLADIIGYTSWTNILGNVSRLGDELTNSFQDSVVRPGENLTMKVNLLDPVGGEVTISSAVVSPTPAGTVTWSTANSSGPGLPATATLYFAPAAGDAGTLFTVSVTQVDSDPTTTTYWYVYVPTADEQKVYISEFLADPTTSAAAQNFNPLGRPSGDTTSVTAWDQYVEIANLSPDNLYIYNWYITVGLGSTPSTAAWQDENGDYLNASSFWLVYGGGNTGDPSVPTNPNFQAANVGIPGSTGLNLPTTGQGIISLYNNIGGLVDRVVYSSSQLNTNGSLSRFPTLTNGFYPGPWISTHWTTAGAQYDNGSWASPTTVPVSVHPVTVAVGTPAATNVTLTFPALTTKASTLWEANGVGSTFQVVNGYTAPTTSGKFVISNTPANPPNQYYFITTQP